MGERGAELADVAGKPLNAVSNGEVGFAAYHPSCGGVFGSLDALTDIDAPPSDPARLVSSIVAW